MNGTDYDGATVGTDGADSALPSELTNELTNALPLNRNPTSRMLNLKAVNKKGRKPTTTCKLNGRIHEAICKLVAKGCSVAAAAEYASVSRGSVYDWMRKGKRDLENARAQGWRSGQAFTKYVHDPRFVHFYLDVRKADSECEISLTRSMFNMATQPYVTIVEKYENREVFDEETETMEVKKVLVEQTVTKKGAGDKGAAQFMLERKYRKDWGPPVRVEISGPDGGPMELESKQQMVDLGFLPLPLRKAIWDEIQRTGKADSSVLAGMGLDEGAVKSLESGIQVDDGEVKRGLDPRGDESSESDEDDEGVVIEVEAD